VIIYTNNKEDVKLEVKKNCWVNSILWIWHQNVIILSLPDDIIPMTINNYNVSHKVYNCRMIFLSLQTIKQFHSIFSHADMFSILLSLFVNIINSFWCFVSSYVSSLFFEESGKTSVFFLAKLKEKSFE
jgi:hypothetical protein